MCVTVWVLRYKNKKNGDRGTIVFTATLRTTFGYNSGMLHGHHIIIIIINDTLARSLEPVVTECKEHTIHTQTQIVASRKPKEIKHTHEGEANFTT